MQMNSIWVYIHLAHFLPCTFRDCITRSNWIIHDQKKSEIPPTISKDAKCGGLLLSWYFLHLPPNLIRRIWQGFAPFLQHTAHAYQQKSRSQSSAWACFDMNSTAMLTCRLYFCITTFLSHFHSSNIFRCKNIPGKSGANLGNVSLAVFFFHGKLLTKRHENNNTFISITSPHILPCHEKSGSRKRAPS